jgi:hypothetical protein
VQNRVVDRRGILCCFGELGSASIEDVQGWSSLRFRYADCNAQRGQGTYLMNTLAIDKSVRRTRRQTRVIILDGINLINTLVPRVISHSHRRWSIGSDWCSVRLSIMKRRAVMFHCVERDRLPPNGHEHCLVRAATFYLERLL